jgi:hypothetical protein
MRDFANLCRAKSFVISDGALAEEAEAAAASRTPLNQKTAV